MVPHLITSIIVLILLYVIKKFLTKNHDYWKQRNVPYLKPIPLFGNHKESILFKKHISQVAQEICQRFPEEPYVGALFATKPVLIVQDLNLVRLILSNEFYYFSGREASDHAAQEPVTKNLFYSGGDRWKTQRQNLTPLFSSANIKKMFYLIKNCAYQLEHLLEKETKRLPYIDVRHLFARYTIDCIISCGFGFESNTMNTNSKSNPFFLIGKKIFDISYYSALKKYCRVMWPTVFYGLKLSLYDQKLVSFFHKLLTEIFATRQKMKSSRNDFVDLILTWTQNNKISGVSLDTRNDEKKIVSLDVNDDLIVGQCVLFFGAGYETTATALSFILYELAKDQGIQDRLITEIDNYFMKSNGALEYECINELPYLGSCITESLRLYPVLGLITREVMEDYTLPTGLKLQKGDIIHIPVHHIHHHPSYFPNPEQFRPERFYGEEKKNITPFTYLAYGEGPRKCIGYRFSLMPMYAGLLTIFKNYRVELPENMPRIVKLAPSSLVITPASPINLKFIPRKK